MSNSILRYLKEYPSNDHLPNPKGSLSTSIPSSAIASANKQVRAVLEKSNKRGKYNKYSDKERAKIGKFSAENGTKACVRKYSKQFTSINESTVRRFKRQYHEEVSRKRKNGENESVTELVINKRGRPVILGESLDEIVKKYILTIREADGIVNTPIVIAGARGIVHKIDRTMLTKYGGPASLTRGWANSILKRINFTRRAGTTQAKISPQDFEKQQIKFLQEIVDIVTMEDIPPELIINWDETGLYLVPSSNWTMAQKGTKRIRIRGLKDKRMITGVFCGSLIGEFLPPQLIYGGKTDQCHPVAPFPADWDIHHNIKHWSNEVTMIRYLKTVIVPFIASTRALLGVDNKQAALAIFDCFRGQVTEQVVSVLSESNIHSVIVPPNCTDRLQPLDLTVNKMAKDFLKREFQEWYTKEISKKYNTSTGIMDGLVDLSTSRMKNVGVSWLIRLYDHINNNPLNVVNGFLAAHIQQSIVTGKPTIDKRPATQTDTNSSDEETDSDDDEFDDNAESEDNEEIDDHDSEDNTESEDN